MYMIACICTLMSAVVLYLTHQNQLLIHQPLAQSWRWFGLSGLVIGAILLLISLPKMVALLTWFIIPMLIWSFIPFLGLIKQKSTA